MLPRKSYWSRRTGILPQYRLWLDSKEMRIIEIIWNARYISRLFKCCQMIFYQISNRLFTHLEPWRIIHSQLLVNIIIIIYWYPLTLSYLHPYYHLLVPIICTNTIIYWYPYYHIAYWYPYYQLFCYWYPSYHLFISNYLYQYLL